MIKPITTRTIAQLHFEDLEPHRFEDLIRQLIYDFRPWRQLEATGRAGADDGFDALGREKGATNTLEDDDADDAGDQSRESLETEKIWLIQCKRERAVPPKKLIKYLDGLHNGDTALYGLIFAAACDFSKQSRDAFREKAREKGLQEAYLWGRAEIEDMLFQPKNDHLLYVYFGFSLQARRRSLKADIRARLSAKRKVLKLLDRWTPILIRDASDERYPFLDVDKSMKRRARGNWDVMRCEGAFSDGLRFIWHRHVAFLDDDGVHWDYAETMDDGPVHASDDPWQEKEEQTSARSDAIAEWEALPEQNRAWLEVLLVLPYENVIDVDEKGDEHFGSPHIYTTPFKEKNGPFRDYSLRKVTGVGMFKSEMYPEEANRVAKFIRKAKPEGMAKL